MAAPLALEPHYGRRAARRLKERTFSFRALYLICLVLTVLALLSFWPERRHATLTSPNTQNILSRDLDTPELSDEACRLVHSVTTADQCAYIRSHCPDDEPGFLAYLDLYYCGLSHVKPVAFILLMLWLGMLFSTIGIAASDFFCINLSTIATILGMSESLAGVTFLALGNGSPDLFSTFAAMSTNSSSLAIGELFGAACFITAVVTGSMALVRPFKVARKSFVRDVAMFTIAVAFSMGFLSDGHLYLWECISMVVYYIFYVGVVVVWHWWITKRAKRRQRDAAARGHYVQQGVEEAEVAEEYLDDPDSEPSRPVSTRGISNEDFRALEGGLPRIEIPDGDEDDDEGREVLGEITTSMLLARRGRRNTITPVRPSLVGALEFQAVMKSLNRQRSMQTIPLHARRYSDAQVYDPTPNDLVQSPPQPEQEQSGMANAGSSLLSVPAVPEATNTTKTTSGRSRAVSANDAGSLRLDPKLFRKRSQKQVKLVDIAEDDGLLGPPALSTRESTHSTALLSPDPSSRASSRASSRSTSPKSVPRDGIEPRTGMFDSLYQPENQDLASSPERSPRSRPSVPLLSIPSPGSSSKSPHAPRSPLSPFPTYNESISPHARIPSIFLPPPASASAESQHFPLDDESDPGVKMPSWWPSRTLPPPGLLFATLFPTLCHLTEKSWWEILLGLVAAPSVFLLTVTLPVVDGREDEDEQTLTDRDEPALRKYSDAPSPTQHASDSEAAIDRHLAGAGAAAVAANTEQNYFSTEYTPASVSKTTGTVSEEQTCSDQPQPQLPNRWLTILQLYLAPQLIVCMLYMQYIDHEEPFAQAIRRPVLTALLISTILLIPLLLTTTSTHRPAVYGPILSLAGFVVSIAWISTIASQVVALLKTFAVILNMSHAILGLTVFAVGNSLGDLVADITVARLGFPVMALSACFGGPMLNILLGIGLSGSYMLISGAQKRYHKHPDRGWQSGTYEIEVGDTLIVSGVTLLVTLVGLLVAVPMSGWMLTRKLAWALIAVWCVGTVINVVLEVTGISGGDSL